MKSMHRRRGGAIRTAASREPGSSGPQRSHLPIRLHVVSWGRDATVHSSLQPSLLRPDAWRWRGTTTVPRVARGLQTVTEGTWAACACVLTAPATGVVPTTRPKRTAASRSPPSKATATTAVRAVPKGGGQSVFRAIGRHRDRPRFGSDNDRSHRPGDLSDSEASALQPPTRS
jgi:hypothetical protein